VAWQRPQLGHLYDRAVRPFRRRLAQDHADPGTDVGAHQGRRVGLVLDQGRLAVAWAVETLTRWSSRHVGIVLMYHSIAVEQGCRNRELVPALARAAFHEHVRHLSRRYRVVRASELPRAVRTRRRGDRIPVSITFDDDLSSHVDEAAPILRTHDVSASFFLTGASLSGPYEFWWERLQRAVDRGVSPKELVVLLPDRDGYADLDIHDLGQVVERLGPSDRAGFAEALRRINGPDRLSSGLRADGVRALVDDGFEIGFHTRRHDPLTGLSDDELERALSTGREDIEHVAGRRLTGIAYPHGAADDRVAGVAERSGYEVGFTCHHGPVDGRANDRLLNRVETFASSRGAFALELARVPLRRSSRAGADP
jgi:peptidoglycan/xylan/chitin deacetylase (PgdA/CDA1 family)